MQEDQAQLKAEAGGMLSASVFLGILQTVSNGAMGFPRVKLMADNSSLIFCKTQHLEYVESNPKQTLKAKYNLTEQIYQTLQEADVNKTFHYINIRGHQDNHISYNNLSFEAQLNVQANQLAEDFYGQSNFQTLIPMLLACPAALKIKSIILLPTISKHNSSKHRQNQNTRDI